jgi:DNA-binding PadR family transcriptional regulator
MPPRSTTGDERTRGALTLYALARMERDGPVHGYGISTDIGERTNGTWRPGPGAIYPALGRLVGRGLARRRQVGRRREYTITPAGRELLRRIRARSAPIRQGAPDLSALWSEVMGVRDSGAFLLVRLRNAIDAVELHLDRSGASGSGGGTLRRDALAELRLGLTRIETRPTAERSARARRRE